MGVWLFYLICLFVYTISIYLCVRKYNGDKICKIGEYTVYYVDNRDNMESFGNGLAFFVCHGHILYLRVHHDNFNRLQYHIGSWFDKNHITEEFLQEYVCKYVPDSVQLI